MVDVGFDLNTREANVNRGKYGRRGKIGEWCKNLGQFLSKKLVTDSWMGLRMNYVRNVIFMV